MFLSNHVLSVSFHTALDASLFPVERVKFVFVVLFELLVDFLFVEISFEYNEDLFRLEGVDQKILIASSFLLVYDFLFVEFLDLAVVLNDFFHLRF